MSPTGTQNSDSAKLCDQKAPRDPFVSASPALRLQVHDTMQIFLPGFYSSNSDSCVCKASTFLPEISPQSFLALYILLRVFDVPPLSLEVSIMTTIKELIKEYSLLVWHFIMPKVTPNLSTHLSL